MRPALAVLVALPLLAAACGNEDSRLLAQACKARTSLGADICDCLADRAEAELTPAAREFLLAIVQQDEARISELRGRLSLEETARVGTFFARAPLDCAKDRE